MVCLGNICRSPLAEGILKARAVEYDLPIQVDSAGTSNWHEGELPDKRSIEIARQRGLDIMDQRSRPLRKDDLEAFDLIICMDRENLKNVKALCADDVQSSKLRLMLSFSESVKIDEVPDPYWGGGFDHVFDLIDEACQGLCWSLAAEII